MPKVLAIDVLAFDDGFDSGDNGAEDDSGEELDECAVEPGED